MRKLVSHLIFSKEFIAISNFEIHQIYCEKNLTECTYCRTKMLKKDLEVHVNEERGEIRDLVEAVSKGRMDSIHTMYEHGNDIYYCDEGQNSLVHIASKCC